MWRVLFPSTANVTAGKTARVIKRPLFGRLETAFIQSGDVAESQGSPGQFENVGRYVARTTLSQCTAVESTKPSK